jgi:hypothetical protein
MCAESTTRNPGRTPTRPGSPAKACPPFAHSTGSLRSLTDNRGGSEDALSCTIDVEPG